MGKYDSSIPTPTPGTGVTAIAGGRSVEDYDLPPQASNPPPAETLTPPPPITNTHLPDPVLLAKAATDPTPRELSITAARKHHPEPVAFGHCIVKGRLIAADDSGDNLIMDILWNAYESDYFIGMWVDGVFEGRADQLGKMQHFEGGSGQVVSSIMDPLKGNDYDVLPGKTHSVLTWNPAYPSLQIEGEGRWTLCRDPRLSPHDYVYTKNFALHLAFVLEELGYTLNWASVGAAADHCDGQLHSPAVARWEGGGQIYERLDDKQIIKLLATYADCYVDLIGGEVYLIPDASRSSNHTVTADDMIPSSIKLGHAGTGNVPEAVTVYGRTVEGEEIDYTYGTPGGPGTVTELRLPWLQTVDACGRKAEEVYKKAQKDMTLEFVSFDNSLRRTIGDVGSVTNAVFELSSELMTLIENEEISRGRWRRKYVQYDPDHNSDTFYSETGTETTLMNPHLPPAGPVPTIQEIVDIDLSGNQFSRFSVTFVGQDYPYLKEYRVKVSSVLPSDFDPVILDERVPNTAASSYTVYTDLARFGVEYEAEVFIVSNVHAEGEAGSDTAIPVLQPDPSILWDSTPIYASRIVPNATSFLDLYFADYDSTYGDRTGCEFYYHHHMLTMVPVISAAFSAGEYLVKWEPVETLSGAADVEIDSTADADGVWYDLAGQIIELNDTASESPQVAQNQIVDVTVAKDDGAGAPVEGTQRTKRVTYYAFRAPDAHVVEDQFTGTNGTALTSHTPNTDEEAGGWAYHSGGFEIQGNDLQATSSNSRAVIDAGTHNVAIAAECEYGDAASSPMTTANLGLIGRAMDSSNYWLLLVDAAATANPILKLLLYTAGTASLKAQKVLTGVGPLDNALFQAIRLAFNGNDIVGTITVKDPLYVHEVRYTSSALSNQTHHGIFSAAAGVTDNWVKFFIARIGDQSAPADPRILWDDTPLTSSRTKALSTLTSLYFYDNSFTGATGGTSDCAYYIDNSTIGYVDVIDLATHGTAFSAGDYVVKYDYVSGSTDVYIGGSTGNDGVWLDLWRQTIYVEDLTDDSSAVSAVIDVSIATDDGAGSPVAGTTKTKRVTLYANRVD